MTRLVKGCNYHWIKQSNKAMRFVLSGLRGDYALLTTRTTNKRFWVNVKEIIFIETKYNIEKANKLENGTD